MPPTNDKRTFLLAVGLPAALHFLLHILTNGNYGIFRDELYYLACANHLAWGYVDQPPLSIAILAGSKALLGDSVQAIRLIPALAGSGLIVLTGLMVRRLGGRTFAQLLAALSVMIVPTYLVITGFYSMNALDMLFWAVIFYLLIVLIQTDNSKLWLWIGAVIGLGALNKIGVLVLCAALAVGVVLTPLRRHLRSKYLWFGAAIAAVIFLPHILWQVAHGWPTLEFIANAKAYKIAKLSPLDFFKSQVILIHPFNIIIWLTGLAYLLISRRLRAYRIFAFIYLSAFVILVLQSSKAYYLAAAYPILLAAGAIAFESLSDRRYWGWLRWAMPVLLVANGALTLPMGLPLLGPKQLIDYQAKLGIGPKPAETGYHTALPQYFADRFDWEVLVQKVASVYDTLPPNEKGACAILTSDYGEASAINYYRGRYGLPRAVSGHNNYYLWGPGEMTGDIVIVVGMSRESLEPAFESVTAAATLPESYNHSFDDNVIFLCRNLRIPAKEAWQHAKHFI
jgi:hypothetical protein